MNQVFIALGANLGSPLQTLKWAVEQLSTLGEVVGVSGLYQTAAVGGPAGQPDYLNAALELRTNRPAAELLSSLHALEASAGRERRERWEARILDLDLITYADRVSTLPQLELPHPRAWERAFVLMPLADLAPELAHPITGETVAQALARLDQQGIAKKAANWVSAPAPNDNR